MPRARIERELGLLSVGGLEAKLVDNGRLFVIYPAVPVAKGSKDLPLVVDVIVPVPVGYPASAIDLAGLVVGSPLLPRVKGGPNSQGIHVVDGRTWQLASYHPHQNGGGPPWDPQRHGFHTYFDHLASWLNHIS